LLNDELPSFHISTRRIHARTNVSIKRVVR
jgi:hypothetical protein